MISFRLKTIALLLSVVMCSQVVVAGKKRGGCPGGVCNRPQQNVRIQQQAPQQRRTVPVAQPVAQPQVSQEEADIQRAQAASLQQQQQEKARIAQHQQNDEDMLTASLQSHQEEEIARLQLQQVIANSLVKQDKQENVSADTEKQETKKPAALKERVKVWFKTKWDNTKTMFGLAKDFVTEKSTLGWNKTKSGFQRLWAKIKPAQNNQTQDAKSSTTTA